LAREGGEGDFRVVVHSGADVGSDGCGIGTCWAGQEKKVLSLSALCLGPLDIMMAVGKLCSENEDGNGSDSISLIVQENFDKRDKL
jgi:hypothetical protein